MNAWYFVLINFFFKNVFKRCYDIKNWFMKVQSPFFQMLQNISFRNSLKSSVDQKVLTLLVF